MDVTFRNFSVVVKFNSGNVAKYIFLRLETTVKDNFYSTVKIHLYNSIPGSTNGHNVDNVVYYSFL